MTSVSFASKFLIVTVSARPDTVITPLLLVIMIVSAWLVALMTTVSTEPSPAPAAPPRSILTSVTSVPVMSLTVTVSVPPSVLRSIVSMLSRLMVMFATSRVSVTPPLPSAESVDRSR